MKKAGLIFTVVAILGVSGFVCIYFYSYVFSKKVYGKILRVERVSRPEAILGSTVKTEYVFSFAVSIKDQGGEIHTGSSEDRQWAVAQEGQCVEAKFFPYPPWNLEKGGTYFGVRLLRLFDCDVKGTPPAADSVPALPSPAVSQVPFESSAKPD